MLVLHYKVKNVSVILYFWIQLWIKSKKFWSVLYFTVFTSNNFVLTHFVRANNRNITHNLQISIWSILIFRNRTGFRQTLTEFFTDVWCKTFAEVLSDFVCKEEQFRWKIWETSSNGRSVGHDNTSCSTVWYASVPAGLHNFNERNDATFITESPVWSAALCFLCRPNLAFLGFTQSPADSLSYSDVGLLTWLRILSSVCFPTFLLNSRSSH